MGWVRTISYADLTPLLSLLLLLLIYKVPMYHGGLKLQ